MRAIGAWHGSLVLIDYSEKLRQAALGRPECAGQIRYETTFCKAVRTKCGPLGLPWNVAD
jgi:hypothetical protein